MNTSIWKLCALPVVTVAIAVTPITEAGELIIDGNLTVVTNLTVNGTMGIGTNIPNAALQVVGSVSEGEGTIVSPILCHAEGYQTTAGSYATHAEGYRTTANMGYAHAEGYQTTATGWYSHVEGCCATASKDGSHAEGGYTKADGEWSHAEGYITKADGTYGHAEGGWTTAAGEFCHAEGGDTIANGSCSHSAGAGARATNDITYVWSDGTEIGSTTDRQYTVYAGNGIRLLGGNVEVGTNLHVVGSTRFDQGITYVAPQGNLSMGCFTNRPAL